MIKKVVIILIFTILLLNNTIFAINNTVIIHYKKNDGFYDDLSISIEYQNKYKKYEFNYKDNFGHILKVDIPFKDEYIIRIFDNDIEIDKFKMNMHTNNEVWKSEDNENINYILPKEYSSNSNNDNNINVKVYYKRYKKDYSNTQLLITSTNTKKIYPFTQQGDYAYADIEISDSDIYYFNIIKNNEIVDFDQGVIYTNSLRDNKIYLIEEKENAFYTSEIFDNEKFIESAYLGEDDNIYVTLYTKTKIENNLTQSFKVKELNGDEVDINFVEPMNVLDEEYTNLFKINVSNISTKSKYLINKDDYGETYLSKKLLYDNEDFNNNLKYIKNLGTYAENNKIKSKIFYPNAERIRLNILEENKILKSYDLKSLDKDIWYFETEDDLLGASYNYEVTLNDKKYIVKEPFPKILDIYNNPIIYDKANYQVDKKLNDNNSEHISIYKEEIYNFISFNKNEIAVSSSLDKSYKEKEEEVEKEIDYEVTRENYEKAEEIENVYIKYFEYDESYLDEKKVIENEKEIVKDESEEVLEVFNNYKSINNSFEELDYFTEEDTFKIDKISLDKLEVDFEYSHFYFDCGEDIEIIRLDDNINLIKDLVKKLHDKNKKVIFNYNIDLENIQFICDEYYYTEGYINTNREIVKKSIYEDIEFLINLYDLDGLTLDMNLYKADFLEELQNNFNNVIIIGLNSKDESDEEFYNTNEYAFNYADNMKSIYKINNDEFNFSLYMTLLSNNIPFFENISDENKVEINKIFKSDFLKEYIKNEKKILINNDYTLLKLIGDYENFDYYTIVINQTNNEYLVNLPTKNNKIVIDNMGYQDNKEYINNNLLLKSNSVYILKSIEENIKLNLDYTNIIIIFSLFIIFIIILKIRKKRRKIFI